MAIEHPAILGGQPTFESVLHPGQWFMPPRGELIGQMQGIFERQYYTENGPLVQLLEARLGAFLGITHAICVANSSIAFLMLAGTLKRHGTLLLPALSTRCLVDSCQWHKHHRICYDLDPFTRQASPESIKASLVSDTAGVFLVDYWSGASDIKAVRSKLATTAAPIFADSTQSFGGRSGSGMVGSQADASVVSLHHSSILSAGEGACIFTQDTDLADRLRTMRSSSGIVRTMPVLRTVNGRMSEAQAALALISLDHLGEIRTENENRCRLYRDALRDVPGITLLTPDGVEQENHEHLICRVDADAFGIDAATLACTLAAENLDVTLPVVYMPKWPLANEENGNPATGYSSPGASLLQETTLRLPTGSQVSDHEIMQTRSLLLAIHGKADAIRRVCLPNT